MLNVKYVFHHFKLYKLYVKHYVFDHVMRLKILNPRMSVVMKESVLDTQK